MTRFRAETVLIPESPRNTLRFSSLLNLSFWDGLIGNCLDNVLKNNAAIGHNQVIITGSIFDFSITEGDTITQPDTAHPIDRRSLIHTQLYLYHQTLEEQIPTQSISTAHRSTRDRCWSKQGPREQEEPREPPKFCGEVDFGAALQTNIPSLLPILVTFGILDPFCTLEPKTNASSRDNANLVNFQQKLWGLYSRLHFDPQRAILPTKTSLLIPWEH